MPMCEPMCSQNVNIVSKRSVLCETYLYGTKCFHTTNVEGNVFGSGGLQFIIQDGEIQHNKWKAAITPETDKMGDWTSAP